MRRVAVGAGVGAVAFLLAWTLLCTILGLTQGGLEAGRRPPGWEAALVAAAAGVVLFGLPVAAAGAVAGGAVGFGAAVFSRVRRPGGRSAPGPDAAAGGVGPKPAEPGAAADGGA